MHAKSDYISLPKQQADAWKSLSSTCPISSNPTFIPCIRSALCMLEMEHAPGLKPLCLSSANLWLSLLDSHCRPLVRNGINVACVSDGASPNTSAPWNTDCPWGTDVKQNPVEVLIKVKCVILRWTIGAVHVIMNSSMCVCVCINEDVCLRAAAMWVTLLRKADT